MRLVHVVKEGGDPFSILIKPGLMFFVLKPIYWASVSERAVLRKVHFSSILNFDLISFSMSTSLSAIAHLGCFEFQVSLLKSLAQWSGFFFGPHWRLRNWACTQNFVIIILWSVQQFAHHIALVKSMSLRSAHLTMA